MAFFLSVSTFRSMDTLDNHNRYFDPGEPRNVVTVYVELVNILALVVNLFIILAVVAVLCYRDRKRRASYIYAMEPLIVRVYTADLQV